MNDQPTPLSDDELSAALDGEVDADTQARIDADPEAGARTAELAAASELLAGASVPPLDAATVDDLIGTALDAPVAPARPQSAGQRRGPAPWLVAAGVAVLMAVGLTLIWSGRNDEDQTASFDNVSAEIKSSDSGGASSGSGGGSDAADAPLDHDPTTTASTADSGEASASTIPSTSTRTLAAVALGTFADGDALRSKLAEADDGWVSEGTFGDGSTRSKAPTEEAFDRCAEQLQVTLKLDDPAIRMGYATVADKPVVVYEFPTVSSRSGDPTTLVAAVGVDACEQVIIFER
jgi:hypothetical protein